MCLHLPLWRGILAGMKSKVILRSELKAARMTMSLPDVVTKSRAILNAVLTILGNVEFVSLHCYEPIGKLREVDVSELFDLPDAVLYTSRQIEGEWHVVSTLDDIAKQNPKIDVIIVPMLGFDKKLQRIGYGGGYYDRLLTAHPRALKIGVCYEAGSIEHVPSEPHDVALDIIITEERAVIVI